MTVWIPFGVLALFELAGLLAKPSSMELNWTKALVNALFLNASHVTFTFVLLAMLPEFKEWKRRVRIAGLPVAPVALALFLIYLAAISIAGGNFQVQEAWRVPWMIGWGYFLLLITLFHSLWQTRGLTVAQEAGVGAPSRSRIWKFSFTGLFLLLAGAHLSTGGSLWSAGETPRQAIVLSGLAFVLSLGMMLWPVLRRQDRNLAQALYLARLPLIALSTLSLNAYWVLLVCHGVEYFFVCRKMVERSRADAVVRTRAERGMTVALLLYGMMAVPLYFLDRATSTLGVHVFSAFLLSLVQVHIVLDRYIFRMRQPAVRETIGPLIR